MSELTLGRLQNRMRLGDEESSVFRNLLAAIALSNDNGKGIISLLSGITNNNGDFGTFGDFLQMGGEALEEVDAAKKDKACIRAIDAQVISQEGQIGDLWQFVIQASDGRYISVSGWGY